MKVNGYLSPQSSLRELMNERKLSTYINMPLCPLLQCTKKNRMLGHFAFSTYGDRVVLPVHVLSK